ncbi:MAG: amidase [Planctomycetes bacterium]|nr:amidase [Planctomycetota bacterium]
MLLTALALCLLQNPPAPAAPPGRQAPPPPVTSVEDIQAAARVIGLELSDTELGLMARTLDDQRAGYATLRNVPLENSDPLCFAFRPLLPGMHVRECAVAPLVRAFPKVERPAKLEDLAYAPIPVLASLVRSKSVSCAELTELALARLARLDPKLHCVVTLCADRARAQAKQLDLELAQGRWRGPLHGIPWGAKDLLATKGVRTTWGAKPYEDQLLDEDAAVVEKLDAAGAVLVAKLSLGELAMDDVWFGGQTRNPWKLEQGSSGSSAGPAAAVASGCVAFAIGSETCGSILSPSSRCGCSSLRPTFGRVSRRGAMALAWTMDKLGPMARSAADAALVFDAIQGADARDESTSDVPWRDLGPVDVKGWKVGVLAGSFQNAKDQGAFEDELRTLGVELVPFELPKLPIDSLMPILMAEAATAFDGLTRSGGDDLLARQGEDNWPNAFRCAQLIPAVEYLRASRVRRQAMLEFDARLQRVDVLVHTPGDGRLLVLCNLTGQPAVVVPRGWRSDGTPKSVAFSANLYDDARALALAEAWQRTTHFHEQHPDL